jgi:hypothetical protein
MLLLWETQTRKNAKGEKKKQNTERTNKRPQIYSPIDLLRMLPNETKKELRLRYLFFSFFFFLAPDPIHPTERIRSAPRNNGTNARFPRKELQDL